MTADKKVRCSFFVCVGIVVKLVITQTSEKFGPVCVTTFFVMANIVPYKNLVVRPSKVDGAGLGLFGNFSLRKNEVIYIPYFGHLLTFPDLAAVRKWSGPKICNAALSHVVDTVNPLQKIDGDMAKYGETDAFSIASRANHIVFKSKLSKTLANNAIFVHFTQENKDELDEDATDTLASYPHQTQFLSPAAPLTCLEICGPFKKGQEIFCDYNPLTQRRFGKPAHRVSVGSKVLTKAQVKKRNTGFQKLAVMGLKARTAMKDVKTAKVKAMNAARLCRSSDN